MKIWQKAIPPFNLFIESLLDWIDDACKWQKDLQLSGKANGVSYVSLAQVRIFVVSKQGARLSVINCVHNNCCTCTLLYIELNAVRSN